MAEEHVSKKLLRRLLIRAYSLEQKFLGGKGLGRIPIAKKIKHFLFSKIQPATAEVEGLILHLDVAQGFLDPRSYKRGVVRALRRAVREGDTVLDIGANIGYVSCLLARSVGYRGKVIAFEPDPGNVELLRKNIRENGFENVVVAPHAVSASAGEGSLVSLGAHSSFNFDVVRPVLAKHESFPVSAVTIDGFFGTSIPKVALIKMDIIGSEAKALAGMERFLKKNKRITILSAFCPAFLKKSGSDPALYLIRLMDLGFSVSDITKEEAVSVGRGDIEQFVRKYSPKGGIAQAELECARS